MSEQGKSWQARIAGATDALARDFVESVSYDWRLYRQDIAGSIAHATMLAKVGLITEADRDAIVRGLKEIEGEIDSHGHEWPGFRKELEDIHMCVESALIERIGEPGRKLHTGRSRNDQVATDLTKWITSLVLFKGQTPFINLGKSFVALAERSDDVVMPSYTHLQRAQPIIASAECLAWAEMFENDLVRWVNVGDWGGRKRRPSPLGSGAIAGTSLPIDSEFTAEKLSLYQPPTSSIEHTASRDIALDFVYACAMTAMHLSRWAEQWII